MMTQIQLSEQRPQKPESGSDGTACEAASGHPALLVGGSDDKSRSWSPGWEQ